MVTANHGTPGRFALSSLNSVVDEYLVETSASLMRDVDDDLIDWFEHV